MIRHDFKLFLRSFIRDKQFSLLNLIGLSIAMATFFLAVQYASHEMSYDAFHQQKDNIYRLAHHESDGEQRYDGALSYFGIGPHVYEEIPEVLDFTRMHRADGMITTIRDNGESLSFYETKAYYVDSSFFNIFSFPLIHGNASKALSNPNAVLISESVATKYFGDDDPMGRILSLSTEWQGDNYIISGVFEDVPLNSQMDFDFIFPIRDLLTNFQFKGRDWYWINYYTYFLLRPNADISKLNDQITDLVNRHVQDYVTSSNFELNFELQPLTDINLYSDLQGEFEETDKWSNIQTFVLAGLFTLVLAWLNYINLSTARASRRSREIGLKKVMGSSRWRLINQFLFEAILTNALALIVAVLIILITFPVFESFFGINLQFDWQLQYPYWFFFLALFVIGSMISSFYPAQYLSSLKITQSLKGQVTHGAHSGRLRKGLMMIQFGLSLFLLIGTTVIYKQISLMKTRDLGMDIENKLIVKAPREVERSYWRSLETFKQEVTKDARVEAATVSFEVPGRRLFWGAQYDVIGGKENVAVSRTSFDHDFLPLYQIKLLAGKNFADHFEGPTAIINEAASKALGFNTPGEAINQKIDEGWQERRIIGVIDNYHQQSPKFEIRPLVVSPFSKEQGYITLDLVSTKRASAIAMAKAHYEKIFPKNAFEYFFMEDYFEEQYLSEHQFRNLLLTFTGLSLIIAALGLIGFSSYISTSRTKEVGIRKVLGADSANILFLFNKEVGYLVSISFLLSSPVIIWITNQWLDNYATRLSLNVIYFILPMLSILVLAVTTISLQLYRLSKANPVKLIRTD